MLIIELIVDLLYSLLRLFSAYILSISVALVIGISMARSKVLEVILYPIIDVLQSIPVLGFFPAVLLFLVNIFPPPIGVEMASIILIFTGQVWNLILGVYSAIKSLPSDFILLSEVYSLNTASRILKIYIPAALFAIASNSVVSWAGGLFFLTACEIISFGNTEYRLRGIGTTIIELASKGDYIDMYIAIMLLLAISIFLYIFLWNPLANIAANISGVVKLFTLQ
ncbi:binding-protein-dependent transport systems inner membrane component [Ignisphaera aggregans DSM 17230]|uniref:Binding-protein-dependent transport systems inner membrane component n=1 Tax=Ignisphaera aggregans (strain DSM 17230 / JCM 13409 / AQ1.S1) TaxID=583356 RepID=E0SQ86_IGNAA|nr:binding-protein-dependent transport systems inner membrane component [Ignisphaera aggregans DSM 17230]